MSLSEPIAAAADTERDAAGEGSSMSSSSSSSSGCGEVRPPARRAGVTIHRIFKATYSGVPVYEFICHGIAVMRRRADAYLNATQILKVANFDKPQRTRILEREVQTGEHEKVQGGYGKYQGTWVPFERGVRLARQYHIEDDLRLVFDYVATAESPPLAPKHITAASNRPRKPRGQDAAAVPKRKLGGKRPARTRQPLTAASRGFGGGPAEHVPAVAAPSVPSSAVPLFALPPAFAFCGEPESEPGAHPNSDASPPGLSIGEPAVAFSRMSSSDFDDVSDPAAVLPPMPAERRKRRRLHAGAGGGSSTPEFQSPTEFADALRDCFLSESLEVPRVPLHLPRNLDVNLPIDAEGHSALHWAAAAGNVRVVRALIQQGANVGCINCANQTPLIRAVTRPDSYESRTFSELLDILRPTMFAQDRDGWTVLHHAVRMAGLASMETAARYYMERLVDLIVLNFEDLFPLVDISDANGDTALALAAKLGDRRLVLVLLKAGGDPTIKNKMNKSADDYATEYLRRGGCGGGGRRRGRGSGEAGPAARGRFGDVFCVGGRPEPPPAPGGETAPAATAGRAFPTLDGLGISGLAACDFAGGAGPLAAGQGAAAAGAAASSAVSREIARTNAELGDVVRMLARIRQDAEDARRAIRTMQPETDRIPELRSQVRELEAELRRTIYHNQRLKVRSLVHQLSDQPAQAPRNRRDLLEELHAKSRPKEGLLADAASMRDALAALLRDRRELVEDAVRLRAECGGPRCNLYRGLIAKCCDVAPDEVDGMVQPMLELLQSAPKGERDLPPRPLRPPQPRPLPGHQTSPAAAGLFIESAAGGRGTRVL